MLEFPTLAEQAVVEWRKCQTTTPFNKIAKKFAACRDDEFDKIVWFFNDDSRVEITGRGKAYKISAELP